MSDETYIRLEGISFRYIPDRPLLSGVNFELGAWERVALRGANGSGKTTLVHLLVGLLRPSSGRVEIFGRPRRKEADFLEVRRRVGLLFQDPEDQLFCPTVAEDVAFGPLNLGMSRQAVAETVAATLTSLGLTGYEDRITYHLSGGEKRLVALASVLAMNPDVLLLDEPLSSLDEESRQRLVDILASLPQPMVLISHDRALEERVATRVVRIAGGRLEPIARSETGLEKAPGGTEEG